MKPKSATKAAGSASSQGGILCGTDFSENARHAAKAAAAIAKRLHEPLILAHAVEMPELGASHEEVFKWLKARRRKDLRREAEEIRKTGAEVETRTPSGRADEALVKLAATEAPRLLVVSSIGRRGAERWLLGSVSERTVERATVPALVVRDARPLVAWADGGHALKIFVCFNFTATSEAALRWVKDLLAIGPCQLVVGCVDWPVEENVRLGYAGPLPLDGNPPEIQAVLERDIKDRTRKLLGAVPFRIRVEANWGRPDARLAEMAKEEGADLVVAGSHQYQGFERFWHASVSRGLVHQAAMSVAIVPARDKMRGADPAPSVRRVLVSTDFSESADVAIPHAYSILRGGGVVHLLHVVTHPQGASKRRSSVRRPGAQETGHVRTCAAKLRALIPADAAAQGIVTQVEVVENGNVAEAICQSAERLGADVICLGTHGRSGLSKALMGSVAQAVMRRSLRPLFVVRPLPQ